MMDEYNLSGYQKQIIKKLVDDSIESVDCRNPGKQLGNVVGDKSDEEVCDALRGLEDPSVLRLNPSKVFFMDRSSYSVNQTKAQEVYNSFRED